MPAALSHSFSVCTMMRESRDVVERFVSFYRGVGAEEIRIYFDGSPPEDLDTTWPGLRIIACDEAFWRGRGIDPTQLNDKQFAAYADGFAQLRSDWMLCIDADEFVTGPGGRPVPMRDLLSRAPEGAEAIRVANVEAVWGPEDDASQAFGSSHARRPLAPRGSRHLQRLLYGAEGAYARNGLMGHSDGKHFLRRGVAVDCIENHLSLRNGKPIGVWADSFAPGWQVVHYDAIGLDRWMAKWRRRVSGAAEAEVTPMRAAQIRAVSAAFEAGGEAPERLFRKLYGLSRLQLLALRLMGKAMRIDPFPGR